MLNHAILAAFLATTAAAFGIETARAAEAPRCEARQAVPDRAGAPAGRPLGTVDTSPREGCAAPRTVRT